MILASHMQARVIISRLDPINVRDLYKARFACILDRDALQLWRASAAELYSLLPSSQRQFKSPIVKRLQQIIERSRLKCPERILIVSRNKHHGRRQIFPEHLDHIEA